MVRKLVIKREAVQGHLRNQVLEKFDYRCIKCQRSYKKHPNWLQIHHVKPVCFGGTNDINNLVPLCDACHKEAPNMPLEFSLYLLSRMTPEHERLISVSVFATLSILKNMGILTEINMSELLNKVTRETKEVWQLMWDCRAYHDEEISTEYLSKLLGKLSFHKEDTDYN